MATSFPPEQVASFCAQWAPSIQVVLPASIDAATLLWAFTGNESGFGANCTPRHEPAYDMGGPYADNLLLTLYGHAGACSYGPFQIMLVNCPHGTTPDEMTQLDIAFMVSVNFMKRQFQRFAPKNVEECGAIWNGGHIPKQQPWPDAIARYTAELRQNYTAPRVPFQASVVKST